jgi:hypothetical protein
LINYFSLSVQFIVATSTKAGVILTDLVQAEQIQQDFFAEPDSERNSSLMQIIDDVNRRYCNKGLFWGAQGVRQAWKPRCDFHACLVILPIGMS